MWLPASECKVPSYASHHLGVAGAVVIPNENDPTDRKLLVVREKSKLNDWKLPGGYSNLGEDFGDAAQREIFEETGIKSVFKSVLTLRNSHNIQFGCSDIYVICRMIIEDPKKIEITIDSEVDDAKWMSLKEFQMTAKNPMLKVVAKLLIEDSPGLTETTMASTVPNRSPYKLYHP